MLNNSVSHFGYRRFHFRQEMHAVIAVDIVDQCAAAVYGLDLPAPFKYVVFELYSETVSDISCQEGGWAV